MSFMSKIQDCSGTIIYNPHSDNYYMIWNEIGSQLPIQCISQQCTVSTRGIARNDFCVGSVWIAHPEIISRTMYMNESGDFCTGSVTTFSLIQPEGYVDSRIVYLDETTVSSSTGEEYIYRQAGLDMTEYQLLLNVWTDFWKSDKFSPLNVMESGKYVSDYFDKMYNLLLHQRCPKIRQRDYIDNIVNGILVNSGTKNRYRVLKLLIHNGDGLIINSETIAHVYRNIESITEVVPRNA